MSEPQDFRNEHEKLKVTFEQLHVENARLREEIKDYNEVKLENERLRESLYDIMYSVKASLCDGYDTIKCEWVDRQCAKALKEDGDE